MHWNSENGQEHNFAFHIRFVEERGNPVQATEYILSLFLWPLRFIHLHTHAGAVSLALTLWDISDKEARLFPQGGPFGNVSNVNSWDIFSFVFLFCSPKGYSPRLNSAFPATAQQVGYFSRQSGRLVAGGHCQADDVQESLIGSPQVLYFQYCFCNKSKTSLVK